MGSCFEVPPIPAPGVCVWGWRFLVAFQDTEEFILYFDPPPPVLFFFFSPKNVRTSLDRPTILYFKTHDSTMFSNWEQKVATVGIPTKKQHLELSEVSQGP